MDENVKKQLDQIGDIVDSKIEKAFNAAQDNAKGEIESSLKSEINNLTQAYNEKYEAATKRMDAIEMEAQKTLSKATPATFKSALEAAVKEGGMDSLLKGNNNAAKLELKAVGDMSMSANFTGVIAGETIVPDFKFDPSRSTHIRSLIPIGSTNAQTIRFVKESGSEGAAAATAQGSTVPQLDFDLTATSVNVEKIGCYLRLTEEMMQDTPQMISYLSARVPQKVLEVEDAEILNGDGSAPNFDGLFTDGAAFVTSASASFYQSVESANEYDVIVAALDQLAASNYQADTILLNPVDFHKIVLLKSTANEYLRNQIIAGVQPAILGVPIKLNTAVTAGKFLVGNLQAATQLWIRDGLSLEFSREDSTNFRDGFITAKAVERACITNYLPNAIVQGTFSTAKTALETP